MPNAQPKEEHKEPSVYTKEQALRAKHVLQDEKQKKPEEVQVTSPDGTITKTYYNNPLNHEFREGDVEFKREKNHIKSQGEERRKK